MMKRGPRSTWKQISLTQLPPEVRRNRLCEDAWKHIDGWILIRWGTWIEGKRPAKGEKDTRKRIACTWFLTRDGHLANLIGQLDSHTKGIAHIRPPTIWANEILLQQAPIPRSE